MPATTEAEQSLLDRTRQDAHPHCVVCGPDGGVGLGLCFRVRDDGGVEADFHCRPSLVGYEGVLHGGVTAALLDGAMTNCLFARGIAAFTAKMSVRYRHPIELDGPVLVRANVERRQPPLYVVKAAVIQSGQVKAESEGRFMERMDRLS